MITVTLIYATVDNASWLKVTVPENATVAQALAAANLALHWPQVEIDPDRLAIFSQRCELDQALHDGDRIEILRPLLIDPKQARLRRAAGG